VYRFDQIDKNVAALDSKLERLTTAFMTREEAELRFTEIIKSQSALVQTMAEHTGLLTKLKSTDDQQQGAIDASRRIMNVGMTIAGLLLTALFIYVSWKARVGK
jgi:hypothetical protein